MSARQIAALRVCAFILLRLSALRWAAGIWHEKASAANGATSVVEELHKRGVEASIQRLTLDPFRGLVARNVRIFDYKHRENTIARHQRNLARYQLRRALPSPAVPERARCAQCTNHFPHIDQTIRRHPKRELTRFRAHIYFPPEQIYVSQAEGIFCGVRISATGQLIKRQDYKPSTADFGRRMEAAAANFAAHRDGTRTSSRLLAGGRDCR